jgi:hypothetical protein
MKVQWVSFREDTLYCLRCIVRSDEEMWKCLLNLFSGPGNGVRRVESVV